MSLLNVLVSSPAQTRQYYSCTGYRLYSFIWQMFLYKATYKQGRLHYKHTADKEPANCSKGQRPMSNQ